MDKASGKTTMSVLSFSAVTESKQRLHDDASAPRTAPCTCTSQVVPKQDPLHHISHLFMGGAVALVHQQD